MKSGPKYNSTQITLSEINTLGVLKNPSLKNIVSYYGDPGDSRSGLVCSRRPVAPACNWDYREWESVFKVHSAGHTLKRGGTKGVRGHILNQTYERKNIQTQKKNIVS